MLNLALFQFDHSKVMNSLDGLSWMSYLAINAQDKWNTININRVLHYRLLRGSKRNFLPIPTLIHYILNR